MKDPVVIICVFILAVLLLAAVILSVSYITYRMAFKRRRDEYDPLHGLDAPYYGDKGELCREMISRLLDIEYEEVSILSRDGLTLSGRLYRGDEGAPLEIECHGYKSHPCRDFSGGAIEAIESGRTVLLIHQRAHNRSEGNTISFGIKESDDLVLWVEWARERFGKDIPILLTGISMGAATVIMAAGKNLPENVRCVIADCPYSSIRDILCREADKMGIPSRLAYPFLRLGAKIFGGFDPSADSPEEAITRATLPVLLIHGENDNLVPEYMTERIRAARPEGTARITFPDADHGMSYVVDREKYMTEVGRFLDEHLYNSTSIYTKDGETSGI